MTRFQSLMGGVLGLIMAFAAPAQAVTGTWTNYTAGGNLAGFWTNNTSWSPATAFPGTTADSAYLTNQVALAYTNVLDAKLNNSIANLAISNALGEAWLVITNTALTNSTTFALGNGGRMQIDNGGTVRVNGTFSWLGTNGTIYVNNGGTLFSGALTYGAGGGVTGLVTGASSGGVWNMGGGALSFGTGATGRDNYLRVANGVILTNVSGLTVGNNVGATSNTLVIAEGSQFFMNTAASILIGSAGVAGAGGNGNSVTLSNSQIRFTATALALAVGFGSSNNTLTLLGDTWVDLNGNNINLSSFPVNTGGTTISRAYNNQILLNGAALTNVGIVSIGYMDSGGGSSSIAISNKIEVINGGVLSNVTRLQIGGGTVPVAGSGYNSLIVTGGGRLVMSPAGTGIIVGGAGAGDNTVILSNSSLAANSTVSIGVGSSNNTMTLLDTIWDNRAAGLTLGSSLATGNILRVNNSLLTNFGAVVVGNTAGFSGNQLIIENGSVFSNVTGLRVGVAAGANSNSVAITGSQLFMNNTTVALAVGVAGTGGTGLGGSDNSMVISNAFIRMANSVSPISVGWGSTNNTLTLLGNTLVDLNSSGIIVAGYPVASGGNPVLLAYNNRLLVDGAVITNVGTVTVGWMNSNTGTIIALSNRLDVVNGSILSNVTQVQVGGGVTGSTQGSGYNSLIVTGGAKLFMNENGTGFFVGAAGAGDNTVILHDSRLSVNSSSIGFGSSNNTVVLENSLWNNRAAGLNVGNGTATGNVLRVSGSVLTNFGLISVGANSASGNQLFIENGSILSNTLSVLIGATGAAQSNRAYIADSALTINSLIVAGNINGPGGANNTAIITNSTVRFTGVNSPLTVGWGSTNSSLSLLAGTRVDLNTNGINVAGNLINFGGIFTPRSLDNYLLVDGAAVTNIGIINLAYLFGAGGSIIALSNRIEVVNGGVLSNVTQLLIGGGLNPQGSGYNSLIVTGGGRLFMEANATTIRVGESGSANNRLIVSDSSLVGNSTVIGNGANSNSATLLDSVWNNRGGAFTVGNGASSNVLVLDNSSLTNISTFLVGSIAGSGSNAALIANGSLLVANTAQAGSSANNNSILVTTGGVLQANSLVIGAATTGNTISNRNGTYQFTNAPTAITSITPGDIALTDGTISFRATSGANVSTNASNLIRNIRYAGTNTFTLNNASNTAAAVSQTYTFNAIAGNPSNFVNLVMVNGSTAYGNVNGANLTIGSSGTMLVSNTTATISGLFTNQGDLRIVNNSTANFTSNVFQSATSTALIDNTSTFAASASILTNAGTIDLRGGTLVLRDLRNQGHLIATGGGLISNALINDVGGYIDVVSGTLTGTPDLINFGVVSNNATFQIGSASNGTVTNSGVIVLNGATFLSGLITNTGTIRGNGTVSGAVLNTGTVAGTNGTLLLLGTATGTGAYRADSGGTLVFQGNGSLSSLWNTGGMVRVVSTVTNTGSLFINAGTLAVVGASYVNNGGLYNLSSGVLTANAARVSVGGVLTNDGTLTFQHSVGTFSSAVVNRGAWITDPSTNIFLSTHTVTTNGYLSASAGDVFRFHNGLQNQSTNSGLWQTLNVTPGTNTMGGGTLFEFAGASVTQTQLFTHPGLLLTGGFDGGPVAISNAVQAVTSFGDVTGFQANFALGQLWLTNTTLMLTQTVAGAGALFVNDLFLLNPGDTRLVIGDNMRLYFVNSNGWDMANVTLLGNGEIHQLSLEGMVVIPEPSVFLLCLAGFMTLWLTQRRRRVR